MKISAQWRNAAILLCLTLGSLTLEATAHAQNQSDGGFDETAAYNFLIRSENADLPQFKGKWIEYLRLCWVRHELRTPYNATEMLRAEAAALTTQAKEFKFSRVHRRVAFEPYPGRKMAFDVTDVEGEPADWANDDVEENFYTGETRLAKVFTSSASQAYYQNLFDRKKALNEQIRQGDVWQDRVTYLIDIPREDHLNALLSSPHIYRKSYFQSEFVKNFLSKLEPEKTVDSRSGYLAKFYASIGKDIPEYQTVALAESLLKIAVELKSGTLSGQTLFHIGYNLLEQSGPSVEARDVLRLVSIKFLEKSVPATSNNPVEPRPVLMDSDIFYRAVSYLRAEEISAAVMANFEAMLAASHSKARVKFSNELFKSRWPAQVLTTKTAQLVRLVLDEARFHLKMLSNAQPAVQERFGGLILRDYLKLLYDYQIAYLFPLDIVKALENSKRDSVFLDVFKSLFLKGPRPNVFQLLGIFTANEDEQLVTLYRDKIRKTICDTELTGKRN